MSTFLEAPQSLLNTIDDLVKDFHPYLANSRIGAMLRKECDDTRGRHGNAAVVPAVMRDKVEMDFIIWICEHAWNGWGSERRQALVDHQLCHCYFSGSGGPVIRPHEIEEFNEIIERYGFYTFELQKTESIVRQLRFDLSDDARKIQNLTKSAIADAATAAKTGGIFDSLSIEIVGED